MYFGSKRVLNYRLTYNKTCCSISCLLFYGHKWVVYSCIISLDSNFAQYLFLNFEHIPSIYINIFMSHESVQFFTPLHNYQFSWNKKPSTIFKPLVLPTFTYGTKFGEVTCKTHWKVFEKGMKIHMISHVKMCSMTTYHIMLAKLGEFPTKLYTLMLIMSFQ